MVFRYLVAAGLLAFAGPGSAATLYDCTMKKSSANDWVSERLVILHDAATGKVTVNDVIIQHFLGAPIEARIPSETKAQFTVAWNVLTVQRQQTAKMEYRAAVTRDGSRINVSALPSGFSNTFQKRGTCKLQTVDVK